MKQLEAFQATVLDYYHAHGRHELPWRQLNADGELDPYHVLVSEIMLQQTQVPRVIPKFQEFIAAFPDIQTLSAALLADVLRLWSGLGYNRRAKFLWQAAHAVVEQYGGVLPRTTRELVTLPGIGPNTAGAILTYAYNLPVPFIETNVRTVFIHHFFPDREGVDDREILDLVATALPDDPRTWYWALMDYGTHLKQTIGNLNKLSKQYTVQSTFSGSKRQVRGQVLRALSVRAYDFPALETIIADTRLAAVLDDLLAEGMITQNGMSYKLPGA